MDRGAWWATVHGVIKWQTRLSNWYVCVEGVGGGLEGSFPRGDGI